MSNNEKLDLDALDSFSKAGATKGPSASSSGNTSSTRATQKTAFKKMQISNSADLVEPLAGVVKWLAVLGGLLMMLIGVNAMAVSVEAGLPLVLSGLLSIAVAFLLYGLVSAFMSLVRAAVDVRNDVLGR